MAKQQSTFNLTNFMVQVRTGMWVFAGIIVLIIIVQIGGRIYKQFLLNNGGQTVAEILPDADLIFGALGKITFPAQANAIKPQTYELAINGVDLKKNTGWPVFGMMTNKGTPIVEVYRLNPLNFSLTAEQKARQIAANLEFSDEPQILDSQTYLFSYPGPPLKENLEINLKTMFMTLTTNYLSVDNVFALTDPSGEKNVPDRTSAIAAVRHYLETAGNLPADLSDAAATVEYAKKVGSKLEPVANVLEADFVTVNLPRKALDGYVNGMETKYNFYGPDNISSIYGVVGRAYDGTDVTVQLNDYYYPLNLNQSGTYYLRSVAEAWQNLQAGEGYVVNPYNVTTARITSVVLGYYESHQQQEYLLPIYVFKGENGFMAYTQALHPNMLSN